MSAIEQLESRKSPCTACTAGGMARRIENLELWVTPQPAGQRAEDLAEWVIATYPELLRRADA